MRNYLRLFSLSILLLTMSSLSAATFNSSAPKASGGGAWDANATWASGANPGCTFNSNHTINIQTGDSVFANCLVTITGSPSIRVRNGAVLYFAAGLTISGTMDIQVDAGGKLIVFGDVSLGGSAELNVSGGGALTVYGNVTSSGSGYDFACGGTINITGTGCSKCTSYGGSCSDNVPLPVNLLEFDAMATTTGIDLDWTTSYEKNNAWFEIQRSVNAGIFEVIHRRQGKINFEGRTSYIFTDTETQEGATYYYRLTQTDIDGHQTRSEIVAASREINTVNLNLVPNPASNVNLSIMIQYEMHSDVLIVLQDISGRTIYSKVEHLESNSEVLSASDLHVDLAPGIYYISASNENKLVRKKLIIY